LRGAGAERPILFIGHLDVVEALRADWSFDPFVFREQDGYFYGRGTQDMKDDDAILVANFLRLKEEGFRPTRDFILALTSDEEAGADDGVEWLVRNHRELIDAAFCINGDGAGAAISRKRRPLYFGVQSAEKGYSTLEIEVTNSGGHSSLPPKENAIYQLTAALDRLARFEFPAALNDVTRAWFREMAQVDPGAYAAEMKTIGSGQLDAQTAAKLSESVLLHALLHTTCVPTMLSAGHAENALPQRATATLNCRILPGDTAAGVEKTVRRVLADEHVQIRALRAIESSASPVSPLVFDPIRRAAVRVWPSVPVVPVMDTGGSDGSYLRRAGIDTYALSGVFLDEDDIRAHGRDERVPVEAFYRGLEFTHRLLLELGTRR
jgi:acetylornithine deacetylase/succinyl-diaminopimelate desuccinylase-like protein